MSGTVTLTPTQANVLGAVRRWHTAGGFRARDGNQERTLFSLRRKALVERRDGRWYLANAKRTAA